MSDRYQDNQIQLPFGYILEHCHSWEEFCRDLGLNPWLLNEGLADSVDLCPLTVGQAQKHGLLK